VSMDSRGDTWPGRSLVKEFALERKLGLAETVGLSLSVVGSTGAMAFNASLVARAAGRAAPLAFVGSSASEIRTRRTGDPHKPPRSHKSNRPRTDQPARNQRRSTRLRRMGYRPVVKSPFYGPERNRA